MEEVYFISLCVALGLGSGFVGGLLGIGGGVIIVPALVLYYDYTGLFSQDFSLLIAVALAGVQKLDRVVVPQPLQKPRLAAERGKPGAFEAGLA